MSLEGRYGGRSVWGSAGTRKAQSDDMPLVTIIIVNHNGAEDIERCLDSVNALSYQEIEVIVVDNASVDGSDGLVRAKYPSVRLVRNSHNLGFAAANNVGIRGARGQYIFLINPDAEVEPSCLTHLVKVMKSSSEIGVCGAKILLVGKGALIQHAGGKYHELGIAIDRGMLEPDKRQYAKVEDVTFVCGAGMLFRRELMSTVGLLDPVFFLYHEDVDFCIRTWLCGWRVVYVPEAVIYHKSGYLQELTTGTRRPDLVFHKNKNTLLILLKNFPPGRILIVIPASLCYRLLWIVKYLLDCDAASALAVVKSISWVVRNLEYPLANRICIRAESNYCKLKEVLAQPKDAWLAYRKIADLGRKTESEMTLESESKFRAMKVPTNAAASTLLNVRCNNSRLRSKSYSECDDTRKKNAVCRGSNLAAS